MLFKKIFMVCCVCALYCSACSDLSNDSATDQEKREFLEVFLPQAQTNLAYATGHEYIVFSSMLSQQITGTGGTPLSIDRYNITPSTTDPAWVFFYSNVLSLSKSIVAVSEEVNQKKYRAMGLVLGAYAGALLSDFWGDVPFEDSFLSEDEVLFPAYDEQQEIYLNIFEVLDEAEQLFEESMDYALPRPTEDLFFQSDSDKWLRFLRFLRLKFTLQLSQRNGYESSRELIDDPVFLQPGEVFDFDFSTIDFYDPPGFEYVTNNPGTLAAGETILNLMEDNDPRIPVFFQPNSNGEYVGSPAGQAFTEASRLGGFFIGRNARVILASYTAQKFMEAEVYFQTGNAEQAEIALKQAIESSLLDHDVFSQGWFDNFVNDLPVNLQTIMQQKYIALFFQPYAWNDWRRTGLPQIMPSENNSAQDRVPRRLPYAQSEFDFNSENVLQNKEIWDPVWWDAP